MMDAAGFAARGSVPYSLRLVASGETSKSNQKPYFGNSSRFRWRRTTEGAGSSPSPRAPPPPRPPTTHRQTGSRRASPIAPPSYCRPPHPRLHHHQPPQPPPQPTPALLRRPPTPPSPRPSDHGCALVFPPATAGRRPCHPCLVVVPALVRTTTMSRGGALHRQVHRRRCRLANPSPTTVGPAPRATCTTSMTAASVTVAATVALTATVARAEAGTEGGAEGSTTARGAAPRSAMLPAPPQAATLTRTRAAACWERTGGGSRAPRFAQSGKRPRPRLRPRPRPHLRPHLRPRSSRSRPRSRPVYRRPRLRQQSRA